jgi:Bacterial Ig-like domain
MKPNLKLIAIFVVLFSSLAAWAQTITPNPANGASGVSVTGPIVFTFSAPVDPAATTATFYSLNPIGSYDVSMDWSAGNTVLTCIPTTPFEANATVSWAVVVDTTPVPIFGQGSFSTGAGSGGGGGGSGTNKISTFSAGKLYFYEQNSAGAPAPSPFAAYAFTATAGLASNVAATAVTVTLPTGGAPVGLTQNFLHHEDYTLFASGSDSTNLEATYPQGNYVFNATATPANLQATVTLPQTMLQPNAPHVSNFAAAQAINASQAFTLRWDAFQGGTASDFITVAVSDDVGKTVFETPGPGTNGALIGTVTSVVIPAGKLVANGTNTAEIVFYRVVTVSNATYATVAYRATGTQLNLVSVGTAGTVPTVSNPVWGPSGFGFDVSTTPNQGLKVLYSTDCSLPRAQWQVLMTTNSPGSSVHITIPPQGGPTGFFQLENSP